MLPRYVVLDKPVGQTPLAAVSVWKAENGVPSDVPTSYAGRLDPMASGLLLVLIGSECRRQKEYTKLDKEYIIEVLLGVRTDTGDVLGIPEAIRDPSLSELPTALRRELGTHTRPYPVFSSKTVKGKPLFMYALTDTLSEIGIPSHAETIYRIKHEGTRRLTHAELATRVTSLLSKAPTSDEPSKKLGADFRISAIRPKWESLLSEPREYSVLTLRVTCGSGTYMRSLAERIGTALGSGACALSIRRTTIGRYRKLLGFWTRQYR